MERIKHTFFSYLSFFISTVLFFVPFFWFKPGEVNLGGDSSRLFLFDPVSYLKSFPLYSVAPGGTGIESISFFFIPFTLLFVFFKAIFGDPHVVVNVYHGLMLALSYLFVDLSTKKLLRRDDKTDSSLAIAAAVSGMFYIFAPTMWNWDKAISSHNQIFLNPLIFYLILQFLIGGRSIYLLIICFITLLFAPNFSLIAAPALFSFYPLAIAYLFVYQIYIRKALLYWKPVMLYGILFLLVHAFHLLPQAAVILNKGSNVSQRIFSATEIDNGLQYFLSVAGGIKLTKNLTAVEPITNTLSTDILMFVFPLLVVISLLLLKRTNERIFPKKTFLLTFTFFLVALFLDTARITDTGLALYSQLFKIPGFSMFRNFHGQFLYVYSFFYALVVGLSVYVLLINLRKFRRVVVIALFWVLLANGWPLVSGYMLNLPLLGLPKTNAAMRVDPQFSETLEFIRSLPIDGKVLTLPLTDPGYQMLSGANGGMYLGPSMIGYLAGRKDFMGYHGLTPFSEMFVLLFRTRDYDAMRALLARLNIRYIFYNSDPAIYHRVFAIFPYETMMQYFPTQESVQAFIDNLGVKKIYSKGPYSVFEIEPNAYLPHVFTAYDVIFSSDQLTTFTFLGNSLRTVTTPIDKAVAETNESYFNADLVSPLSALLNNYHLHRHDPFVTRSLNSPFYVFAVAKEIWETNGKKNNPNNFLDFNLFYATKRIAEVEKYGTKMPVEAQRSNLPLLDYGTGNAFYSWEVSLRRYEQSMHSILRWIQSSDASTLWKESAYIKLAEQLFHHELRLEQAVRSSNKPQDEVEFLIGRIEQIFASLRGGFAVPFYDPSSITYELNTDSMPDGGYEIYLQNTFGTGSQTGKFSLIHDGKGLLPSRSDAPRDFINFGATSIASGSKQDFQLRYDPYNLASSVRWFYSGQPIKQLNYQELIINNTLRDSTSGLIVEIPGLVPRTQYVLTFSYNTNGDNVILRLINKETTDGNKDLANPRVMKYFEKQLNAQTWQLHQSVWTTDNYPANLYLQIVSNNNKSQTRMLIKDLSVVEVEYPKLIFKSVSNKREKTPVRPKIAFTKMNPTKYLVSVRGAAEPFTLVFAEEFNTGWKVYQRDNLTIADGIGNYFADKISKVFAFISTPFVRTGAEPATLVATYFNGEIEELKSQDAFISSTTFETWGKNPIAKDRHMLVNGYANAWRIEPQDVKRAENYELIIELASQKIFYLGLGISIAGSILGVLLFLRNRRDESRIL